MPLLLSSEYYTLGKAANYSLSQACQLIGLVLAGGLIAWIGSAGVLWIDAVTFAISAVVIAAIQVSETRKDGEIDIRQIAADFREGLSFLGKSSTVQVVSIIGLVINFGLMPLSLFQTPYVNDYLKMGPEVLSNIKILMILGMMSGAAIAPKLQTFAKAKLSVLAGIGMGISIVCIYITVLLSSVVATMVLLTLSMFCVGVGGGILNVVIGGCMMSAVPKDMMGRMSGLNAGPGRKSCVKAGKRQSKKQEQTGTVPTSGTFWPNTA